MFKSKTRGTRIHNGNLGQYIHQNYHNPTNKTRYLISSFRPILQSQYGGANDCTLCSITAISAYKNRYKTSFEEIYNRVVSVANKFFYDPDNFGTFPLFIQSIINRVFNVKSSVKYIKNVGYSWKTITSLVGNNIPLVLSMNNDGRNYYINHSVIIVGYMEYTSNCKMLIVYDNWDESVSYIDFNKLSKISCINYF